MPDTFLSWGHRRDKFSAPMDLTYIFKTPSCVGQCVTGGLSGRFQNKVLDALLKVVLPAG